MVAKVVNGTFWVILLLVIPYVGVGCVAEPAPIYTPETLATTSVVLTDSTSQPTIAPDSTEVITPIQTPTPMMSPTPHPILNPSVLKDITVFYMYSEGRAAGDMETTKLSKIKADGSGKQGLFATERLEGDWRALLGDLGLSHDGRRLVFIKDVTKRGYMLDSRSLWVMNTDGSEPRELVGKSDLQPGSPDWSDEDTPAFLNKERPVHPVWSPDDSLIAFVDSFGVPYEPGTVCILDVESGRWWELGEGEIFAWSPDGRALAVHSKSRYAAVHDPQILNLDGTARPIMELSPSAFLLSLDWSVATGLIVAQGRDWEQPGVYPIFVIDPYNGGKELLVDDSYEGYSPRWSPDGKMISFERIAEDIKDLYVLDFDSGDVRLVMPNVTGGGIWSPGSRLMLVSSEVEGDGLYIVSVSDGSYWKIPNTEGSSSVTWQFLQ